MSVRNFWIEADVDGRATKLTGGPVRKDGGIDVTIYIRDEGGISRAVSIRGRVLDETLRLTVSPGDAASFFSSADGGFRVESQR
jgi:hypothetical protein